MSNSANKNDNMTINKKLSSLYSKVNVSLSKAADEYNKKISVKKKKTAYPLYINVNKEYEDADVKILIFGQETDSWCDDDKKIYSSNIPLSEILAVYNNFFGKKECYTRRSNFWPSIRNFINLLQKKNNNVKIDYLWNEIVKMGYYWDIGKPDFYESLVKPFLNKIIIKEIKIIKPDYIIFFTGPNYDYILDDIFNSPKKEEIIGFQERQLCKINIPNVRYCFRTYHPRYLRQAKLEKRITKKMEKIINDDISNIRRKSK